MRYVEVGGVKVSVIGLGTWQFGSREWGYGPDYAEGEALAIARRALDLGINLIDTAEAYALGRSERIVGRAIAGRREEAFLATKIFPVLPLASVVEQRARASAGRLGVDRLDLYQLHWPNPVVPLAQTMEGMSRARASGLVAHVGVSNFPLARWQEAESLLGGPVLSNQVRFNLVDRRPEEDLLPWAQANGRLVIAYSPLAQGLLSARYGPARRPGGMRALSPAFLPESLERAAPLMSALEEVAGRHGASPAQVALAWVVRRPNVVAIPGASSVSQLEANAAAADLELSDDEDARLVEAAAAFHPVGGLAAAADLAQALLGRR